MSGTYQVVRFFADFDDQVIVAEGLTLEEAKAHCSDPEASSITAKGSEAVKRTERCGPWFEGFREERP